MCMKWFVLEALFATHDSKSALKTLMTSLSHPCSAKTGAQLDMTNNNTSTEHGFLCLLLSRMKEKRLAAQRLGYK